MKNNVYQNLYNCLLESDELYELFDNMTGIWEKDKIKFIEAQKELEQITKHLTVEDLIEEQETDYDQ
jgi:hypothetical protein